MSDNNVEMFSESLQQNVIYNKFHGTLTTSDKVFYSRKEMKALINQEKKTGDKITKNQHLAKKIFEGEIVEYDPKPRLRTGKTMVQNKKDRWEKSITQPDMFED